MPATLLSDRYELRRVVGRGGMAEVWEAHDQLLGRRVAVKVLHPGLAGDPTFLERLRREATASASLNHPSMVPIYDAGVDGSSNYLVMEFLEGDTLADQLDRGRLDMDQVVHVGVAIAGALDAVHDAGLVHRDVKPANIMVTPSNEVKLMDLGIARGPGVAALTATDSMIGTAGYVSPEQAKGSPADARSDIYGLGCVLFEAATGRQPFAGDTPIAVAIQHISSPPPVPSTLNPRLPPGFDAIVARALAKDPDDRYSTARDLAADLRRVSSGDGGSTVVAPTPPRPPTAAAVAPRDRTVVAPRPRRSPGGLVAVGLVLIVLALAVLVASATGVFESPGDDVGTPDDTLAEAPAPDDTPDATDSPTPDEPDQPSDVTEPSDPTSSEPSTDFSGLDDTFADFQSELDRVVDEDQIDQSARDSLVATASDAVSKARAGEDDALDDVASLAADLDDLGDVLDPSSLNQLRRLIDRLDRDIRSVL